MSDLYWHQALDACTTLDAVRLRWHGLLEAHQLTPQHPEPRYRDAVLSFLGLSPLPARLKLACALALVSGFDFDLRLALGALGEEAMEDGIAWPESVAAAVADQGPAPDPHSADPWLSAFVAGRLAGLRDTLPHDGCDRDAWRRAFDAALLETACRHGDPGAAALALGRGADPGGGDWAALQAAASADAWHEESAPAQGRADHGAVLSLLLDAAPARAEALGSALCAAAAAGDGAMLERVLAEGPDLAAHGRRALAAAARRLSLDAFERLRECGAAAAGPDQDVLAAAVSTLDQTMIETALAAGCDARAGALAAWRAALRTRPWDLYSAETRFTPWRADAIALLLGHGARPDGIEAVEALRAAADGPQVAALLAARADLDQDSRRLVARLAALAWPDAPG